MWDQRCSSQNLRAKALKNTYSKKSLLSRAVSEESPLELV